MPCGSVSSGSSGSTYGCSSDVHVVISDVMFVTFKSSPTAVANATAVLLLGRRGRALRAHAATFGRTKPPVGSSLVLLSLS